MPARRGANKAPAATPRYLENAALHYLERYASSAENLRRVLMRRVVRSAQAHGSDPEEGRAEVDRIVARMTAAGYVDDRRYAESSARSLVRRGRSVRGVRATLAGKGVPAEVVEESIERLRADEPDLDLKAAVAYARRRRLGPFRTAEGRSQRRDRDLAAMARAGYPLGTAREVIDAADPEALTADLFGGC